MQRYHGCKKQLCIWEASKTLEHLYNNSYEVNIISSALSVSVCVVSISMFSLCNTLVTHSQMVAMVKPEMPSTLFKLPKVTSDLLCISLASSLTSILPSAPLLFSSLSSWHCEFTSWLIFMLLFLCYVRNLCESPMMTTRWSHITEQADKYDPAILFCLV